MTKYGYIRVSSTDQSEARQVDAMRAIPICESRLYMDKQSGKDFCRPRRPVPPNFDKICQDCESGRITQNEAARRCKMSASTLQYKYKNEYKKQKDRENRICDDHGL